MAAEKDREAADVARRTAVHLGMGMAKSTAVRAFAMGSSAGHKKTAPVALGVGALLADRGGGAKNEMARRLREVVARQQARLDALEERLLRVEPGGGGGGGGGGGAKYRVVLTC